MSSLVEATRARLSEHDAENNLVLAGTFTATPATDSTAISYRIFTYSWQITPNYTTPAVYSYALDNTSPNAIYGPETARRRQRIGDSTAQTNSQMDSSRWVTRRGHGCAIRRIAPSFQRC